jgi:hypothetical protein
VTPTYLQVVTHRVAQHTAPEQVKEPAHPVLADKTTDPTQANAEVQMALARSRLPVPNDVDTDERRHTMAIE